MPTTFKYVPILGNISGNTVLKQTERAINELGEQIDHIDDSSQHAVDIANDAMASATDALNSASHAETVAANALYSASNAQNTADNALYSASNAQNTADNALSSASNAKNTADNALSSASDAQNTADNALSSASNAKNTADNAQIIADSALSTALSSTGVYETIDIDEVDIDFYYYSSGNFFFTSPAVQNSPIPPPVYLSISVDDNLKSVTQFLWGLHEDSKILYRTGTIAPPPEGEELFAVQFTSWRALGGGSVYANPFVYPGAIGFFYEKTAPIGWKVCTGQILTSADAEYQDLWDALLLPENAWKILSTAEWQAKSTAAGGIGGVPHFVLDTTDKTIRLPDLRGDQSKSAGRSGFVVGDWHNSNNKAHVHSYQYNYNQYSYTGGPSLVYGAVSTTSTSSTGDPDEVKTRSFFGLICTYTGGV